MKRLLITLMTAATLTGFATASEPEVEPFTTLEGGVQWSGGCLDPYTTLTVELPLEVNPLYDVYLTPGAGLFVGSCPRLSSSLTFILDTPVATYGLTGKLTTNMHTTSNSSGRWNLEGRLYARYSVEGLPW